MMMMGQRSVVPKALTTTTNKSFDFQVLYHDVLLHQVLCGCGESTSGVNTADILVFMLHLLVAFEVRVPCENFKAVITDKLGMCHSLENIKHKKLLLLLLLLLLLFLLLLFLLLLSFFCELTLS